MGGVQPSWGTSLSYSVMGDQPHTATIQGQVGPLVRFDPPYIPGCHPRVPVEVHGCTRGLQTGWANSLVPSSTLATAKKLVHSSPTRAKTKHQIQEEQIGFGPGREAEGGLYLEHTLWSPFFQIGTPTPVSTIKLTQ